MSGKLYFVHAGLHEVSGKWCKAGKKNAASQAGRFTNCTVMKTNDEKDVQEADWEGRGRGEDC